MDNASARALLSFVASVLGLAILSVILSSRSNTVGVIGAAASGLAGIITAATAPVTGAPGTVLAGGGGFGNYQYGGAAQQGLLGFTAGTGGNRGGGFNVAGLLNLGGGGLGGLGGSGGGGLFGGGGGGGQDFIDSGSF